MDELRGLENVIGSAGTLHGIEAPPEREAFKSDEAYEKALADYYGRITFWHAKVMPGD